MNSTHDNCKLVVFSNKAWNAIVSETFRKDPVETGGILLGHILSNGYWIVMEVVPPGLNAIHQVAYFEYDTDFVNYMANSISRQYKIELSVLGLWHRHPGSMDVFSGTDDGTNTTFAQMNQYGAISGLVNIDPQLRFTLRHVIYPLHYKIVDVEVGDDLIPEQYFELRYNYSENMSPIVPDGVGESPKTHIAEPEHDSNIPNKTAQKEEKKENSGDGRSNDDMMKNIKRWTPIAIISVLLFCLGICIGKLNDNNKNNKAKIITEKTVNDSPQNTCNSNETEPADSETNKTNQK